jgi:two-component system, OmpR family, phosphate regulon sensor histidine kinase PhoR
MELEHLAKTIEAVAVPVVALDHELTVIAANKSARKAFVGLSDGASAAKAISKKRGFLDRLSRGLEHADEQTLILKTKQGFGQEFLTTIKPLDLGKAGSNARLLLSFQDRTPLKDVKTMRSEFVANVSHEIRSPLTAITGFIETLQGPAKNDPDAWAHFLTLMEHEAARMVNLVTDLLSLSQVEVKQRRRPKKLADPNQIIAQAMATTRQLAEKRDMVINYHAPDHLPDLPGLHDDLLRVFINLLENAVHYGRAGAVITVQAHVIDSANPLAKPALSISVTDQGEGIPPVDIPHLTERFYRVDKSRSRNVGGTGLGLAIVKHILVRHRGKMLISSQLGHGSTFTVYLPLQPPQKI